MKKVLHILTKKSDALAREIISQELAWAACEIETVDLTSGAPDYAELLQKVFSADSVAVW